MYNDKWLSSFSQQIDAYKTSNLLVLYGDDFAHRYADISLNMAKEFMSQINQAGKGKYLAQFSSVRTYLDAVYAEAAEKNTFFTRETGDFWKFNHAPVQPHAYWSGYYSTYPEIKKQIMDFSDMVQSWTQIVNLSGYHSNEALVLND